MQTHNPLQTNCLLQRIGKDQVKTRITFYPKDGSRSLQGYTLLPSVKHLLSQPQRSPFFGWFPLETNTFHWGIPNDALTHSKDPTQWSTTFPAHRQNATRKNKLNTMPQIFISFSAVKPITIFPQAVKRGYHLCSALSALVTIQRRVTSYFPLCRSWNITDF